MVYCSRVTKLPHRAASCPEHTPSSDTRCAPMVKEQFVMRRRKESNMKLEEEREAKLLQIMPVPPGWEAVWGLAQDPEEGLPGFTTELIACWALVEVGERRFVTALLPDLESGELKLLVETEYFLGYRYPTELTNWERLATARRRSVKK